LLFLIASGDLSANLERLYPVCVCRKTLNPEEHKINRSRVRESGKFIGSLCLVNEFALGRRFALSPIPNDFNTSNLQQFHVKTGASLVSRFRGRYITLSAYTFGAWQWVGERKQRNENWHTRYCPCSGS
jgi:hypothetical protein